jgi:hypothetical protein
MAYEASLKDLSTGKVIRFFQSKDPVEAANLLQKHIHIKYLGEFRVKPVQVHVKPIELGLVDGRINVKPAEISVENSSIEKVD